MFNKIYTPFLALALVACGGEATRLSEDLDFACTDNGAADFSAALGNDEGDVVSATSPSATYGSSACGGFYVVEATSTLNKRIRLGATFHDGLALPAGSCPFALTEAKFYGLVPPNRAAGISAHWELIAHQVDNGNYALGCHAGTSIDFESSPYSKVRVAAKAGSFVLFYTPAKVDAYIDIPVVPK